LILLFQVQVLVGLFAPCPLDAKKTLFASVFFTPRWYHLVRRLVYIRIDSRWFVGTCVATFENWFRIECVNVFIGVLEIVLPLNCDAVTNPVGDQVSTFAVLQPLSFTACSQVLKYLRPGDETSRGDDLPDLSP
jgi:hypothetical protein